MSGTRRQTHNRPLGTVARALSSAPGDGEAIQTPALRRMTPQIKPMWFFFVSVCNAKNIIFLTKNCALDLISYAKLNLHRQSVYVLLLERRKSV